MDIEEKRARHREACRRWRERNPDKVREANRRPRKRTYDPVKNKAWRRKRLEEPGYRERLNAQAQRRSRELKEFLNTYKLSQGCTDCGYRAHPAALVFDHVVGTKELNVSFAKSIGQARREIAKCVVRCQNCHAMRHYEESHGPSTGS